MESIVWRLSVFRPIDSALEGPQGSGKAMILSLLRYEVLTEYVKADEIHEGLDSVTPFVGISIYLQRAYFQPCGRRSAAIPGQ
jgi:predicted ABC-type ATPase